MFSTVQPDTPTPQYFHSTLLPLTQCLGELTLCLEVEFEYLTLSDWEMVLYDQTIFFNFQILLRIFDPLEHMKKKIENKNLKFSIKTVSVKTVTKVRKAIKKEEKLRHGWCHTRMLTHGTSYFSHSVIITHITNYIFLRDTFHS